MGEYVQMQMLRTVSFHRMTSVSGWFGEIVPLRACLPGTKCGRPMPGHSTREQGLPSPPMIGVSYALLEELRRPPS
jgi:hypothetical protein